MTKKISKPTRKKKDDMAAALALLQTLMKRAGLTEEAFLSEPELLDLSFEVPELDIDDALFSTMPDWKPPTASKAPLPVSGKRPISIRIDGRVLLAFREQAEKTGTPYQTLINRALQDAADTFT